jgi:hypothetical protein
MDQHSENPPTNRLPTGIDEAKLLEAVRSSGYPLQSLVAQDLSSRFTVVEEWGYTDRTTKELRSLDIYAFRELGAAQDAVRPRLHLLMECKRSDMPFVFFPPGVRRPSWDFPEMLGFSGFHLSLGNNTTQGASPATFFCAEELPFVSSNAKLAVTLTRSERKGANLELSGQVPFNQIVLPLASAMEQLRQMFGGGSSNTPMIVLSVCVVDAPMIVASGTPEAPRLSLEPWVRVVRQETIQDVHHWKRQHYTVDCVHRDFLSAYLESHALPFAEALATRVREYRNRSAKDTATRPKDTSWDAFMKR